MFLWSQFFFPIFHLVFLIAASERSRAEHSDAWGAAPLLIAVSPCVHRVRYGLPFIPVRCEIDFD